MGMCLAAHIPALSAIPASVYGYAATFAYLMLWILMPLHEGAQGAARRLRLSAQERMIGGVCGGLGEHFELDPILFRAAFLVLAFVGGLGILLYVVLWLLMPAAAPRS